jgi:organic radical activating enzyme
MTNVFDAIKNYFAAPKPLPPGNYAYQAPPDAPFPYRLHLRIEANGSGVLILNGSTVLHLNQTATEYAYHLVKGNPAEHVGRQIATRYKTSRVKGQRDYKAFTEQLRTLIDTPDLDPVTYLGFDRQTPYTEISAPYRLDCALTYRLPEGVDIAIAPTDRVKRELSADEWKQIIDKSWQVGIPHLIFTGGEPTLRDDLLDILAHAEINGQVTGLLTNGLRLTDSAYFEQLVRTGLDHVMVVLNPDLEQSWRVLEVICPDDLFTAVHLTITPQNKAETPGLIKRLADMKANALSLSISDPSLAADLENARELAANLGLSLVWDLPVPYSNSNPVSLEIAAGEYAEELKTKGADKAWLYVEPDGDVLPAQGINKVLGNLLTDPWESIWKQPH